MATPTYTLIDSVTLTTNTANVTFTNLPTDGTYGDLVIVLTGTMAVGTVGHADIKFNLSTSNYNVIHMDGDGSSTISRGYANQGSMRFAENNSFSTTTLNTTIIQVFDYAEAKQKSVLIRTSRADGLVAATAGVWADTSAINRFILGGDAAYEAGTTVFVYGIASEVS